MVEELLRASTDGSNSKSVKFKSNKMKKLNSPTYYSSLKSQLRLSNMFFGITTQNNTFNNVNSLSKSDYSHKPIRNSVQMTEEELERMTKEFDKEPDLNYKKKKMNNKIYSNSKNSSTRRKSIRDVLIKVVSDETKIKLDDIATQNQSSVFGNIFETVEILNKSQKITNRNKLENQKKEKEFNESIDAEINGKLPSSQMSRNSVSINNQELTKEKFDVKENDFLISQTVEKFGCNNEIDPQIEANLARISQHFAFMVQVCEDKDLTEAVTYYNKNTKFAVSKYNTSVNKFKHYLGKILGLNSAIIEFQSTRQCTSCLLSEPTEQMKYFQQYINSLFKKDYNYSAIHKRSRETTTSKKKYEISLTFDLINKEICLKAIFEDNLKDEVFKKISLDKLQDMIANKLNSTSDIPNYFTFNYFKNLNEAIQAFVIHHVFVLEKDKYTLALSPQLLGNNLSKLELSFLTLSNKLMIDIFVYSKQKGRLIIYEQESSNFSMSIDIIFDDYSFLEYFLEITNSSQHISTNIYSNQNFKLRNPKITKNANLIQALEKVIYNTFGENTSFYDSCNHLIKTPFTIFISKKYTDCYVFSSHHHSVKKTYVDKLDQKVIPSKILIEGMEFSRIKEKNEHFKKISLEIEENQLKSVFDIDFELYSNLSEREKFAFNSSIVLLTNNDLRKNYLSFNAFDFLEFKYFLHHNEYYNVTILIKLSKDNLNFVYCTFNVLSTYLNYKKKKILIGYLNKSLSIEEIKKIANHKNNEFTSNVKKVFTSILHDTFSENLEDANILFDFQNN